MKQNILLYWRIAITRLYNISYIQKTYNFINKRIKTSIVRKKQIKSFNILIIVQKLKINVNGLCKLLLLNATNYDY